MIQICSTPKGLLFSVRVTPKAGRDIVMPYEEGDTVIKIKVSAPPEDGKANQAVEKLLANALGLSKSQVEVIRGHKARDKQIVASVEGQKAQELAWTQLAQAIGQTPEVLVITRQS